ncbi:MAG: ATP-binding cassette subfamily F protein uup [Phenylobacterium sp.]|jgi:ATP-binding cassette subfamily F protein uup
MMDLVRIVDAQLSFGMTPILDRAEFKISSGERVCIVGRNGAGKSTLMQIIEGIVPLDSGEINRVNGIKIARLEQDPPKNISATVYDYIAAGVPEVAELLTAFHDISHVVGEDPSDANLNKMDRLQSQLDAADAWQFDTQISLVMSRLELDGDVNLSTLSGGWLRKVALARALVRSPDLLLLDEPTNHLDVNAIEWLESFLKDFNGAVLFISHDRAFIHRLATRIVDLDRGYITSFPGDYGMYLLGKEEALQVEAQQNALFDKRLAEEEVWIRQGVKARRTRNEGRVRALESLRKERQSRVEKVGTADISVGKAQRSGKLVFESKSASFAFDAAAQGTSGGKMLVKDFSTLVMRGDRIGLVGPNGVGKTTLIKLLLGDFEPTGGVVKQGVNLEIAYFDQYRLALDETKTVQENVADGKQEVIIDGNPRHVLGYLQDFLFSPARARTPVSALSGGEKNRLLLAKLFLKPSNVLVLDEPTNDLDIETLELLEEIVAGYQGTVLTVSHDRAFINNTVTSIYAFEGNGHVEEIFGGFDEYKRFTDSRAAMAKQAEAAAQNKTQSKKPVAAKVEPVAAVKVEDKPKKLSYKMQRELEALPALLETLETEVETLQSEVNGPAFFKKSPEQTAEILNQLSEAESKLDAAFSRWEELEG